MAQLAIKGHITRGEEVIEILEMLGYINKHKYTADCDSLCFYGTKYKVEYNPIDKCLRIYNYWGGTIVPAWFINANFV